MEVLKRLKAKIVFVDTAPFIYFIENNRQYSKFLDKFFSYADQGNLRIVTSSITLLEVLVHPYRNKRPDLVEQYEEILTGSSSIHIVPVDTEIAKESAKLRSEYNLQTPDAIQLAVAQHVAADFFLTNDKSFVKIKIPKILLLEDLI